MRDIIKKTIIAIMTVLGWGVIIIPIILLILFVTQMIISVRGLDKYGVDKKSWDCEDSVYYTYGDFQDYIDYGEYYFNEETIKYFDKDKMYSTVTEDKIKMLKSYFTKFEDFLRLTDFEDKYTFDKDVQIDVGDYYYIHKEYEDKPYDNFDVYYVDMDCNVVYFVHANI